MSLFNFDCRYRSVSPSCFEMSRHSLAAIYFFKWMPEGHQVKQSMTINIYTAYLMHLEFTALRVSVIFWEIDNPFQTGTDGSVSRILLVCNLLLQEFINENYTCNYMLCLPILLLFSVKYQVR